MLVNALLVLALFSRLVHPLHDGRVRDPSKNENSTGAAAVSEMPDRRMVNEAVVLLGPRSRMCSPRRCTRAPSCTATACRPTARPSSLRLSSRRTSGGRSCTTARHEIPRDCVVRSHASVRECPVDLFLHGLQGSGAGGGGACGARGRGGGAEACRRGCLRVARARAED